MSTHNPAAFDHEGGHSVANKNNSRRMSADSGRDQSGLLDPLTNPAWDELVAAHPESTFFHGSAWARVLQETYGHRPFYFCRLADGRLKELLPVMEVSSFWTGRRGVSLPFTDFCTPLRNGNGDGGRHIQLLVSPPPASPVAAGGPNSLSAPSPRH